MSDFTNNELDNYDLLIVGAGIFGLTFAQKAARDGKKVLIIDKRNHIGGNAYSEFDKQTGIEVHKYGAHLFHTSDDAVWEYVNQFSKFTNYVHRVYTTYKNEVFPMPINLGTINQFFRASYTPDEARGVIKKQAQELANKQPTNLDEQGISLIGRSLYEAFIKNYTAKQWQTDPKLLDPSIIRRLPVRYNYDNRYFNDKYEGLPEEGYAKLFENMVREKSIDIKLSTDFFDENFVFSKKNTVGKMPIVYTGPIDKYFNYKYGQLGWRTLDFEKSIENTGDYQGIGAMNYADLDQPFTRILEFRHFHPERNYPSDKTVIVKEFSRFAEKDDEPYYPVNTPQDADNYAKYQQNAKAEPGVIFGGRLGEYKYFDMHQVFAQALQAYKNFANQL
ncbi:MAG: UDP-galactopyranose mutase [Bifidobacteriaceae bacterium]|jgi:UDP-galactopyranose mutase|nr:UDP-galactopyranose mutase [Bifidobacteriaceae bacterium]